MTNFVLSEIQLLHNELFMKLTSSFMKIAIVNLLSSSLDLTVNRVGKIIRSVWMSQDILVSLHRTMQICGFKEESVKLVQSWVPDRCQLVLDQTPNYTRQILIKYIFYFLIFN